MVREWLKRGSENLGDGRVVPEGVFWSGQVLNDEEVVYLMTRLTTCECM